MLPEDQLETYRSLLVAPIISWIESIGAWKAANYSGVSKRKITNLLYRKEFDVNTHLNDFVLLFAAYQKSQRVNKKQNYGWEASHKVPRFRKRKISK